MIRWSSRADLAKKEYLIIRYYHSSSVTVTETRDFQNVALIAMSGKVVGHFLLQETVFWVVVLTPW